jgi:hypothetical protein
MKKTYAIIEDGKVINVAAWDGESDWEFAEAAVEIIGVAGIGWDYIDGEFIDNRQFFEEDN